MEYNFADAVGAKCKTDFFFTTFNDRLHPLNALWQKALERHFKRPFTPIHVVPAKSDCLTEEDNFIVLNAKQSALRRKARDDSIVDLIYPEDLNK